MEENIIKCRGNKEKTDDRLELQNERMKI